MHGGLAVMENQLFIGQGNAAHLHLHRCQNTDSAVPGQTQAAISCKIGSTGCYCIRHNIYSGKRCCFLYRSNSSLFLFRTPKTVFVDQTNKFQLLEQLIQFRTVIGPHNGIHGFKINGCLRTNGGEVIGKVGIFPVRLQLFPELGADGFVFQIGINTIQRTEFQQQVCSCLGTNAGNTGNVIRGIAHQRFQINELFGLKPIFLFKFLPGIQGCRGLSGLGDHQFYMDIFINKLQTVPVAGNNDTLPLIVGADSAYGTNNIVCFPSLAFVNGNIHGPQNVLHHRHLHGKFFRHAMSVCLIAVILQVTEGGAVKIKGNADRFRLLFLFHLLQNVQKTVNGMGIKPLPCGKGPHTKIGSVNNTVAV